MFKKIIFSIVGILSALAIMTGCGETVEETTAPSTTRSVKTTVSSQTTKETTAKTAIADTTSKTVATDTTATTKPNTTAKTTGNYTSTTKGKTLSPTERKIINLANVPWYLVLANENNQLPSDFTVNDVIIKGGMNPQVYRYSLDSRIVDVWNSMYAAAAADGYYLTAISTYRSYSTQEILFEEQVSKWLNAGYSRKDAEVKAAVSVMYPGCSDHNLGLGVDICNLNESFDQTGAFKWLKENAEDYGFILRYPKDKVSITKVKYEPWHWRYVGVDAAREMNSLGMCLEEYHVYKGIVQ